MARFQQWDSLKTLELVMGMSDILAHVVVGKATI